MKHIFLTGDIQTGKSTIINRALSGKEIVLGGYKTVGGLRRSDGNSYVHLLRADTYEQLSPQNRVLHRKPAYGRIKFEVNRELYNTKGVSLLKNLPRNCQLILMDEIGTREKHCLPFRQAIMDTLDGDIPVLGVVQIRPDDFLDEIRSHPKVELITVTPQNREAVYHYVEQHVAQLMTK